MARKYNTWYQKESRGGSRFVDISKPENYERLTKEEKHYLEYQERTYKYSAEDTAEAYRKDYDKSMRINAAAREYQMLTGELYEQSLESYGESYMLALDIVGHSELRPLFRSIWNRLSPTEREAFSRDVIPTIPIFYRTARVAGAAKTNQVGETQIEGAMEELGTELLKQAIEKGINIRYYLRKYELSETLFGMSYEELRDSARSEGLSIKRYVENLLDGSYEG